MLCYIDDMSCKTRSPSCLAVLCSFAVSSMVSKAKQGGKQKQESCGGDREGTHEWCNICTCV